MKESGGRGRDGEGGGSGQMLLQLHSLECREFGQRGTEMDTSTFYTLPPSTSLLLGDEPDDIRLGIITNLEECCVYFPEFPQLYIRTKSSVGLVVA